MAKLKRLNAEHFLLFFLFFYGVIFFSVIGHFERPLNVYQARDIHTALGLLQGEFVWSGPDLLGGGKALGPFFYWLLAVPLWLFKTWKSVNFLAIVFTSAAAVMYFQLLKLQSSKIVALTGYTLFLSAYPIQKNLLSFWNPSYVLFFQVLLLGLLFHPSLKISTRVYASLFVIALSLQIHMSQLVFLLPVLYLCYQNRRQLNLALAAFAFLLPLLPYVWGLAHSASDTFIILQPLATFFNPDDFSVLHLVSYLKNNAAYDTFFLGSVALLAFGRSHPFSEKATFRILAWPSLILALWAFFNPSFIRYGLIFTLLLISVLAHEVPRHLGTWRIKVWFAIALLSLTVQVFLRLPNGFIFRDYSILIFLVIGATALYFQLRETRQQFFIGGLLGISVISAVIKFPIWTIIDPTSAQMYSKYGIVYSESLVETENFTRFVQQSTNWNYDEFRSRSVVVGFSRETDLSLVYPVTASGGGSFDGLIAIRAGMPVESVPPLLMALKKSGELVCEKSVSFEMFEFCFYKLKDALPETRMNNIGAAYQINSFKVPPVQKSGLERINETYSIYHHWGCSEKACYFRVELRRRGQNVNVFFDGYPIAVPDAAINPYFTAALEKVELRVQCEDGRQLSYQLAVRIGFSPVRNTFLAPFNRTLKIDCAEPTELSLEGNLLRFRNNREESAVEPLRIDWL